MIRRLCLSLAVLAAGCVDFDRRLEECRDGGGLCAKPSDGGGHDDGGQDDGGRDDGGVVCPAGQQRCDGVCTATASDPLHCGSCTNTCAAGDPCYEGQCRSQDCSDSHCGPDQVCVDGSCTQKACLGIACSAQSTCVGGQCLPRACTSGSCRPGLACLDGGCVDVSCDAVTCADGGPCEVGRCDGNVGCLNHLKDPHESDVDCGGSCPPCVDGRQCRRAGDCASGLCGDGGVCLQTCAPGATCGTNPGVPCKAGAVACVGGAPECTDGANEADGVGCGTDKLCVGGVCTACVAGQPCTTNADPCKAGVTRCSGGTLCANGAPLATGASCGVGQVCNSAGACVGCAAQASCTSNVSAPCKQGVVSCAAGVAQCLDAANAETGTICGIEKICWGGACVGCASGQVCVSNPSAPCKSGVTSCGASPGCMDGSSMNGGTACGSNLVCNGNGQCISCTPGAACTTNPSSPCRKGVTDCSTGTQRCIDSGNAGAGTACGTNQVCNGSGTCVACTANQACATNPGAACREGVTSCVTGASTCVDGAAKSAGTGCGGSLVCDGNGYCGTCVPSQSCSSNPSVCRLGVTACSAGVTNCNDGSNRAAGVGCGVDQVCNGGGACVGCVSGQACTGNSDPCAVGVTSCATGAQTCVNGPPRPPGSTCGTNQVCTGGGACVSCLANQACTTNTNRCMTGVTSCRSGTSQCDDYEFKGPGLACGSNLVCNGAGSCVSCTAGQPCADNPGACFDGVTECTSGAQRCVDDAVKSPGTTCGPNRVCNGSGQCANCSAGLACSTNPNSLCAEGVTSCSTGVQTCVDAALKAAGTGCGANLVCTSAGACSACTAGQPCATNPSPLCRTGLSSCATGVQACVDASLKPAGTNCGAGLVCDSGGSCGACTAGLSCGTNPGAACFNGITSCATGTTTCVDGAAKGAGASCGSDLVCSAANVCVACAAGVLCGTNPGVCKNGVTSCATGASVCIDGTAEAPGTICGTNQVCNAGACVACAAGVSCGTNPNSACQNGITSCASGSSTCVDGSPKMVGTSCGPNQVCNSSAACVTCLAGLSCGSNPNSLCATGVTSCQTGISSCVDEAPLAPGTSCGTNLVCDASAACVACTAGGACAGNPGVCKTGTNSCATGALTCVDSGNKPGGTSCGPGMVCDGNGVCGPCTAGQSCATNPGGACVTGTTSCATGSTACVDGAPRPAGASCGLNQVCSSSQVCVSCTAGDDCSSNANPCRVGVTSCASGAQSCIDSATLSAPGSTCGTGKICDVAGACVNCTPGAACTTNPGPCFSGLSSCSGGVVACLDSSPLPVGTSCGSGLTCDAAQQCVP